MADTPSKPPVKYETPSVPADRANGHPLKAFIARSTDFSTIFTLSAREEPFQRRATARAADMKLRGFGIVSRYIRIACVAASPASMSR